MVMILAHMAMNRGKRSSKMDGGKQNERGQSKTERGQELMRAVGMAGKDGKAGKTQPAEQALQANTASGLSARLRPQKNKQPAVGRPRSKTMAADDVGLPLAVQCR